MAVRGCLLQELLAQIQELKDARQQEVLAETKHHWDEVNAGASREAAQRAEIETLQARVARLNQVIEEQSAAQTAVLAQVDAAQADLAEAQMSADAAMARQREASAAAVREVEDKLKHMADALRKATHRHA